MNLTIFRNNFSHTYHGIPARYDFNFYRPEITSLGRRDSADANIELRIDLKINLRRDDDGTLSSFTGEWGARNYRMAPWPDAAWTHYRTRFLELARFWDNRFWLKLTDSGRRLEEYRNIEKDVSIAEVNGDWTYVSPMIVKCTFNPVLSTHHAHYDLNAVYLVNESGDPVPEEALSGFILRSDSANIDSGDIYGEYMVAHEVGHRLGLPHIGVETDYIPCVEAGSWFDPYDSNARACYHSDSIELTQNIMGSGTTVDWRNAVPWRVALRALTGLPVTAYTVHTNRQTSESYLPEGMHRDDLRSRQFQRSSLTNPPGFLESLFN
ncbi:hypothetical protein ABDK00_018515 [Niabella insulamsoli]|uniref:hypothetical protein n=1 Tax=Niabella insulamsoli TaxID=3144874 RepID=UPI0031FD1A99